MSVTLKDLSEKRAELAARYGFEPYPVRESDKVGIARNVKSGQLPLNGLRCPPDAGTTGWFIWAGETQSDDPDFFVPLHASHLSEWCPAVLPFLELPPGWRFLIAPGHEDVWFDPGLDQSAT
jgi:hypothetical protein